MARLIRMDTTGHSTLAEWTAGDHEAIDRAVAEFRRELDSGYYAMVTEGEGHARQVTELPLDTELVILRRPIAGGRAGPPPPARCRKRRESTGGRGWMPAASSAA